MKINPTVVKPTKNRDDPETIRFTAPDTLLQSLTLILLITACYAAYNLLIKVSGNAAGVTTSPLLATISLQLGALTVSLCYLMYLWRSQASIALPAKAYPWAIAAGICIGLAEIMYFYLFRGSASAKPVTASVAVPLIVGGTIIIVVAISTLIFNEKLSLLQWSGAGLALLGLWLLANG